MDWRLKGTIQKVLGMVPGGERVHHLLQRRGGGLTDFGRECDIKVDDWRLMMGHLRASKIDLAGATLLEMGTGWYPTFPFCLYLGGAARVHTVDLNRHLRSELVTQLADRLATHVPLIAREAARSPGEVEAQQLALAQALARSASLESATSGVIDYRAPADAASTGLPASSVDVVFSNSVLEHVPGPVIEACLAEAMRILRPGGIVFHSVNCGDHYAYIDRSINQLHYLQYSESSWRKWNNAFLYQNRLRAIDFLDMAKRAGFTIEIDTSRAKKERLAQLDAIRVDPSFARYSREQLAITSIDFVGRKPS
jgi:SAM-dependent methyltransferase